MSYTPGPLSIARASWSRSNYVIQTEDEQILGEVFVGNKRDDPMPAKANARLWAAAPDLLDACNDAYAAMHTFMSGETPDFGRVMQTVDAARKKAVLP